MSAKAQPTPAYVYADAQSYHQVMGLLQDMQMEHGLCKPRSRLACTHCNARDELAVLLKAYPGPRVLPAESL